MQNILKRYFGFDSFRPLQEDIIGNILAGHDVVVLMPTGGGKSLCYQVPALMREGTTVVISPLISLMKDQVEGLRANGVPAAALNSMNDEAESARVRAACLRGELKLLYISPERLMLELPYLIRDMKVSLFAVDEAHCISQWGHDFRPEYAQLGLLRQTFSDVPIVALTATADRLTREDIQKQLALSDPVVFISSFDRPNLSLDVKRGYQKKDKDRAILELIARHPDDCGIIYCLSKKTTESVAEMLRGHDIAAVAYHAGLPTEERERAQDDFIHDRVQVVCATVAFGMGIDKSNVRFVIHYNLHRRILPGNRTCRSRRSSGGNGIVLFIGRFGAVVQVCPRERTAGNQHGEAAPDAGICGIRRVPSSHLAELFRGTYRRGLRKLRCV